MMYRVVDNQWNRANAPELIGREYDAGEAPSYVALVRLPDREAPCPLCGEREGHSLSCMTRWYG